MQICLSIIICYESFNCFGFKKIQNVSIKRYELRKYEKEKVYQDTL